MAKLHQIAHRFVERVPSPLEDGVVYVSIEFATVIHKCCCGCGDKVVTPLTPVDWAVAYNGQFISLYPSIGRWDAPCRSHYLIRNNRVIWADEWSTARIDALKRHETDLRGRYFDLDENRGHKTGSDKLSQGPEPHGWLGQFRVPSPSKESDMANVYVEPQPKGRPEGSAITHYVLEYAHGARVTNTNYPTQAEAVSAAKALGHQPLIARVRNTDKGNPDHWRAA